MIAEVKKRDKPAIFVTSEEKEDWWTRIGKDGPIIGPRPELIAEMHKETGKAFYIYSPLRFLEHINNLLGKKVSDRAISEVKAVDEGRLSEIYEAVSAALKEKPRPAPRGKPYLVWAFARLRDRVGRFERQWLRALAERADNIQALQALLKEYAASLLRLGRDIQEHGGREGAWIAHVAHKMETAAEPGQSIESVIGLGSEAVGGLRRALARLKVFVRQRFPDWQVE